MASRVTAVVCVLWLTLIFVAVGRAQTVRELTDPDAIVFRGAQAYTPRQIAQGLRHDEELRRAAVSTNRMADFLDLLQKHVLAGYLDAGFSKATVSVAFDDSEESQIIVEIEEGPQFTDGEIRITGVPDEIAQCLRQRLIHGSRHSATEDTPGLTDARPDFVRLQGGGDSAEAKEKEETPLWKPGHAADLGTQRTEQIRQRIQAALADAGYPSARFRVHTEFHQTAAHLTLDVYDRGVQSVVSEIYVAGNQRDTDEEVIRYVGLEIGESWTAQCKRKILGRLWESASFCDYGVTADIVAGRARVSMHVAEYPDAPTLVAGPSREDAAILKLCDWFSRGEGRERDLVMQYANDLSEGSLIVSSHEGAILELARGATEASRQHDRHGIVFTRSGVQMYAAKQQVRFSWANTCAEIMPEIDLSAPHDPGSSAANRLLVSFSVRPTGRTGPPPAMSVTLNAPPLFFRSIARDKLAHTEWHGDELTISNSDSTLRVDARTGELLEFVRLHDGKVPSRITVRPVANAYRQRVALLETDSRDWRVFPDPARNLSSTVEFLCLFLSGLQEAPPDSIEEAAAVEQQRRLEILSLVGRLAELGLLTPLESFWANPNASSEKQFYVPQGNVRVPKDWKEYLAQELREYSGVLFAADAWPAVAWQQGCSMWGGVDDTSRAAIPEICRAGNYGPLACYVLALMLAPEPLMAEDVAAVGLQRLDRESFLQDCTAFFAENHVGGETARKCCKVLTDLTPREVELIESYLGSSGVLARCADALKRHATDDDPALAAAGELWDRWLRGQLEAKLQAIQGTDPLMSTPFPLPPKLPQAVR